MLDFSSLDDIQVYRRVAGDSDSQALWKIFLDRFEQPCYRVIRRSLLRRMGNEAAEELSHEIFQSFFLSLLNNDRRLLKRYRGDGGCTPRTYLCYLAGYHVLSEIRSRKSIPELFRHSHSTFDDPEHPMFTVSEQPGTLQVVAGRQMLEAAIKGLESLSEIDQRIFRSIYVENRSLKEISESSGDSLSTVRVQHHRLRKRLKAFLADSGHSVEDDMLTA